MKALITGAFLLATAVLFAQAISVNVERNRQIPLEGEVDFSNSSLEDWDPFIQNIREQPHPASDYGNKKEYLSNLRRQMQRTNTTTGRDALRGSVASPPIMLTGFSANSAQGTPNDNHMAISNDGKIVSVVNTNLRIYNDTGALLQTKSLSAFAGSLGVLSNISDPRVVYDPQQDRFVLLFFAGSTSSNSKIIVAFSKTNDPVGIWNFYKLNGNYLNDTTWSDYPIVALSDHDLFISFNQLKDGFDWKTGFRYSVIWQIDKSRGFSGDTLQFNYWHNIEFNGRPVWNVCPVQGGLQPSGPVTYFVSVRSGELINDTVFLHSISDSYQSGNALFNSKVLKSNLSYGLPPNAIQKDGQYLATNDARVLCGFYENDKIQYVQNCIDAQHMTGGIYVGVIDAPSSLNPVVSAQLISFDTIDLGYPSIAYAGNNAFDNRALITCSFSSSDTFPGTAAFYRDANGNISDMVILKNGEAPVNVLVDTVERWGDYTGIQRKYNEPNTAWISGSYVYSLTQSYRTWIAKIVNADSSVVSAIGEPELEVPAKVFPNPASEHFKVQFELAGENFLRFAIYDAGGKLVRVLLEDRIKAGTNIFSFDTQHLPGGVYFLNISNNGNLLKSEKVIISR